MLEKVFKDHKKWLNTVKKMGCTKEQAEDIVGDMYINVGKMLDKGLDISYGDEVNYYYIYRALRNGFLNFKNKQKKEHSISIDLTDELKQPEYIDFESVNEEIEKALEEFHWYDRKVYNLIMDKYSLRELSEKTNITYHSLYNTYRGVKNKLKEKITR
jgi:DNA-directed RNA polymerase specialized sigma24 family protein